MSLGTLRFGALFNSSPREPTEMTCQFSKPKCLDSSLFENAFDFAPTASSEGIQRAMVAALPQANSASSCSLNDSQAYDFGKYLLTAVGPQSCLRHHVDLDTQEAFDVAGNGT